MDGREGGVITGLFNKQVVQIKECLYTVLNIHGGGGINNYMFLNKSAM